MGKTTTKAAEAEDLQKRIAELGAVIEKQEIELRAHELREKMHRDAQHRRQQDARRRAEEKARRDRINDLAAGKLDISNATDWGIVHEDGRTGIQVFVPLDGEEQRVALGYLRRKAPDSRDRIIPFLASGVYPAHAIRADFITGLAQL